MQLFANNADSSLNGAIASDTAVLTLKTGEGSKFPSPSNGDYFLVTLYQKLGSGEINHEIVKCTSRAGDNLTIVRAQEGTTAKAFNDGDLVELRITKGTVENFAQPENLATKEPVIAAPSSVPTEKYWRGDKTWRDFFTDVRAATLTGLSTATNAVVVATDTVLTAIGKLQAQVSSKVAKSGDTMTGNLMVEGVGHADVAVRSYGYGGDGATMHGYQSRGTKALPTAPTAGDPIFGIGARPYTGAGWAEHSVGAVHIFARQNITPTQQGTSFRIATTPLDGTWGDRIHAVAFECDGVGQGARWRAKFSGPTQAERTLVQDASGAATAFGVVAGGASGSSAAVNCFSRNNPDNSPYVQLAANETIGVCRVYSGALGPAQPLPLVLGVGNAITALTIDTSGNVLATGGSLGYGVGAGGAVVQATSKSTAVTLNKPSGQITMHSESLASGASVSFVFNNSFLGANDGVLIRPNGFTGYAVEIEYSLSATSVVVRVTNRGATRSDPLALVFQIVKGVAS